MRKLLLLSLLVNSIAGSVSAAEFMEYGSKDFKKNKLHKDKWIFETGINFIEYPTSLPSFEGTHESVKEDSKSEIYGMTVGFGREFLLGAGFSTALKANIFYSKSDQNDTGQGAEDVDIELSENKITNTAYGSDISISINYLFENKVINVQPFAEFGAGVGASSLKRDYSFRGVTGSSISPDPELYDVVVDEEFNYNKVSLGVNFISLRGITSYIKASRLGLAVSSRKTSGSIRTQGNSEVDAQGSSQAKDSLEVLSASLGIGFLF